MSAADVRWPALVGAGTVVGVDAGGSGTRAVVVHDGAVGTRLDAGPANALLHPDAAERLAALVVESGARRGGVGLPGLRTRAQAEELTGRISALAGVPVAVSDDARTALLGAFGGEPGIIVIAGTGSVALGWDGRRTARAGGHGFLLGDEGGGYWLGREAVRAALAAHDGGPGTVLTGLVDEELGGPDAAVAAVHGRPTDRGLLAGLAPAVAEAAGAGDPVAADIVARAADALAALVDAVRDRLGPLRVSGIGRVLGPGPVAEELGRRVDLRAPLGPPELGAAVLAARGGLDVVDR